MPQTGRKIWELGLLFPWLVILYGLKVDMPPTQG